MNPLQKAAQDARKAAEHLESVGKEWSELLGRKIILDERVKELANALDGVQDKYDAASQEADDLLEAYRELRKELRERENANA